MSVDITPVLVALASPDDAKRNAAEREMNTQEERNPGMFFTTLASYVARGEAPPQVLAQAAYRLKVALNCDIADDGLREKRARRWHSLDAEIRKSVKNALASALANANSHVRRAAAQVVAKVGVLEIPRRQWPELLPTLWSNIQKRELHYTLRQAALQALGYLCDELDSNAVTADEITKVMGAVTLSMGADRHIDVRRAAVDAMNNTLHFASSNFEDENAKQRDGIMQAIRACMVDKDLNVRRGAYDCILKVANLYYGKLKPYMAFLYDSTLKTAREDDDDVAVRAIEFWNQICDTEYEIGVGEQEGPSFNYARHAMKALLPLLTHCMQKQSEDEADGDTWDVAMAASTCLGLLAQTVRNDVVQPVMDRFVKANLRSPNWHAREAAILAFGSVMDGPSNEVVRPYIERAFPIFIQLLASDPSVHVRDTTAWTLTMIIRYHPSTDVFRANFDKLIVTLDGALEREPRVVIQVAAAIMELSKFVFRTGPDNPMAPRYKRIVQRLMGVAERPDWEMCSMRVTCYVALENIVEVSTDNTLETTRELLKVSLSKLAKTFEGRVSSEDEYNARVGFQALSLSLVNAVVNRLGETLSPDEVDAIMRSVVKVLQSKSSSAHEEAFNVSSSLTNVLNKHFGKYMEALLPYIKTALSRPDDYALCSIAIGLLGDICRSCEKLISPYAGDFVSILMGFLNDDRLDRSIKPPCIATLGDIAMAMGPDFKQFLLHVMTVLKQACATKINDDSDEDARAWVVALRKAILEAYTCIVQGFMDVPRRSASEVLGGYYEGIVHFLYLLSSWLQSLPPEKRDPSIILSIGGLIGDLAKLAGPEALSRFLHSRMEWVNKTLSECQRLEMRQRESAPVEPGTPTVAEWAQNMLRDGVGGDGGRPTSSGGSTPGW